MGCSRGGVGPGKIACGTQAGNCNDAFPLAIVSRASNFKGNSAKGVRRRNIMTSSFASFLCVGPAYWLVPVSCLPFGLEISRP